MLKLKFKTDLLNLQNLSPLPHKIKKKNSKHKTSKTLDSSWIQEELDGWWDRKMKELDKWERDIRDKEAMLVKSSGGSRSSSSKRVTIEKSPPTSCTLDIVKEFVPSCLSYTKRNYREDSWLAYRERKQLPNSGAYMDKWSARATSSVLGGVGLQQPSIALGRTDYRVPP